MLREIPKLVVAELSRLPIEREHARRSSLSKRLLRDQLFGKLEVKVRDEHVNILSCGNGSFTARSVSLLT